MCGTLYKNCLKSFSCDFTLQKDDIFFKGKVLITESDEIEMTAFFEDCKLSTTDEQRIEIKADTFESYFKCILTNLQIEGRKEELSGKGIDVNFPKCKISPNLTFNFGSDGDSEFVGSIYPLYSSEHVAQVVIYNI